MTNSKLVIRAQLLLLVVAGGAVAGWLPADEPTNWQSSVGQEGPTGWRCHVIRADPRDDGPDGIQLHDWNGDGRLDVFSNAEEGAYSRLYLNPGDDHIRQPWTESIEFRHGPCEDSGSGDLDNDGDVDYIANGGWVYFNPGGASLHEASHWKRMTLFDEERRVPTVADVDGDGLHDLIVGAQEWYKQPKTNKHDATAWQRFVIGDNHWPMNCILTDVDRDGDTDMVVSDRGVDICWYVNPGPKAVTRPWQRKTIHKHNEAMFMAVADVNDDGNEDFVIAGGYLGEYARRLIVLLRTNQQGDPTFQEIVIDQPSGNFPKGVAVFDIDGDPRRDEIVVIPQSGDLWTASYEGDAMNADLWKAEPIVIPGAASRKKMDNVYPGDLDGDGDIDILTTEENGGWGVIWFENPAQQKQR